MNPDPTHVPYDRSRAREGEADLVDTVGWLVFSAVAVVANVFMILASERRR